MPVPLHALLQAIGEIDVRRQCIYITWAVSGPLDSLILIPLEEEENRDIPPKSRGSRARVNHG